MFIPGQKVVFTGFPAGWLNDLPEEDQAALRAATGKPVQFKEFEIDGRAELEFTDINGICHTIWLDPKLIRSAE